jgi:hypothetical protein
MKYITFIISTQDWLIRLVRTIDHSNSKGPNSSKQCFIYSIMAITEPGTPWRLQSQLNLLGTMLPLLTFGSTLIFTNGGKSAPLVLAANNHD